MRHIPSYLFLLIATTTNFAGALEAAPSEPVSASARAPAAKEEKASLPQKPSLAVKKTFHSFTGKILGNKVRMRLLPNLEGMILREFNPGEPVLVIGESEDFYAIQPPQGTKAYIYRIFVLDGVIEGSRVNVRLEPDLSSPVIGQMNTGERVTGTICDQDKKWMEIAIPASAHFYVAKEYVEKVGDANVYATLAKESSLKEGVDLVSKISEATRERLPMQKASVSIRPETIFASSSSSESEIETESSDETSTAEAVSNAIPEGDAHVTGKMATWIPVEQALYEMWLQHRPETTMDDFYQQQNEAAVILRGIIEPYHHSVKNKPGDFLLVSQANHLPIAYLYSTHVNLQEKVGYEVSLSVAARDNHHFAFPAYFVLEEK